MTAHDSYKSQFGSEDEPDSLAPAANVLAPVLGLVGIGFGALLYAMLIVASSHGAADGALTNCVAIADAHARLACYDEFARPHQPSKGALAPLGPHPHESIP